MKTLIIYKSKYGSTKEYAEYIKQNIPNSEIYSHDIFDINTLSSYDNVIIGSSTYASSNLYRNFLTKNWETLKDKRVFVFAVGMLPSTHSSSISVYKQIPEKIRKKIKYIKLPGRIVLSKLNVFEKLITKTINSQENIIADLVDLKKADSVIMYFNSKE